jgi:hypothetical protein
MVEQKYQRERRGDEMMADLARQALEAFRADMSKEYEQLVKTYDGSAAAVGLFGVGSVTIAVQDGEVTINPPAEKCPPMLGRGATYPEVILALAHGRMTGLDAFHRGDLLIQVDDSEELHRAYDFFVRFSEPALRSQRLRGVLKQFEEKVR